MTTKVPFNESELEIKKTRKTAASEIRIYNTPISYKENTKRLYTTKDPMFAMRAMGFQQDVSPSINPDNIARAFVFGGEQFNNAENGGGTDMFGVDWVYVPAVGGSMVKPGNPIMDDANDWKEIINFPDIDSWDWEGNAKINNAYLSDDEFGVFNILNGAWFERLVSFMDFEGAVLALIDEDQKDAVKELFEATTDLLIKIVDKVVEYYPGIDAICVHDDWGGQANPFFSEETAMEMIVPYMKKLTDHIKAKGKIAQLHSCGHNEKRINCYIAAGWQSWTPQNMNDTMDLYNNYGDKILITIHYPLRDGMTDEEQRAEARKYVDNYCKPGKPSRIFYDTKFVAFEEELYRYSREKYLAG